MAMRPGLRKLVLTTHVSSSVGWLGAVAAFLALAVAGLSSAESEIVRSAYVAMHLTTWYVIVPLALASFFTGVIEGLGTPWGILRHYWVVTKFVLTILATALLFLHTQPVDRVANVAMQTTLATADLRQLRLQLVGDASAALFVLWLTTMLSIYKPWGMTPYGIRQQLIETEGRSHLAIRQARPAGQYVLIAIAVFVGLILFLHLFGVSMHGH